MKFLVVLSVFLSSTVYATKNVYLVSDDLRGYTATASSIVCKTKVYTLTNKHVCEGVPFVFLIKDNSIIPSISIVKKIDDKADLCLLSNVEDTGIQLSDNYVITESVDIYGYPESKFLHSRGNILGFSIYKPDKEIFLTSDAYANLGSSGSPVLNSKHEVVGVVARILTGSVYKAKSFIVPLEFIKEFLGCE